MLDKIKRWARELKLDIIAIYIASKDARTPRMAKLLAIAVAAYALSPVDLIPDFIPVLGLVDDFLILPAGIALIVRLIPPELMDLFRQDAKAMIKPSGNWMTALLIIALLVLTVVLFIFICLSAFRMRPTFF